MEFTDSIMTGGASDDDGQYNGGNTDKIVPTGSTDLACEVCNKPLVYAGRGRKPRFCEEHKRSGAGGSGATAGPARGAGRGNASVEQAIATLGNMYDMVGMAFFLATPDAFTVWSDAVPDLQTRNRAILQGDPELVKMINRVGVKGGKPAFIIAQGVALFPALMVARAGINEKLTARQKKQAEERRAKMREQNTTTKNPGATGTTGPEFGNREFF